jgi:hypothetical protein
MTTYQQTLHNLSSLRTLLRDLFLNTDINEFYLLYKEVVNNLREMRECPQLTREQMNPTFARTYSIQEHRMRIISYENKIPF